MTPTDTLQICDICIYTLQHCSIFCFCSVNFWYIKQHLWLLNAYYADYWQQDCERWLHVDDGGFVRQVSDRGAHGTRLGGHWYISDVLSCCWRLSTVSSRPHQLRGSRRMLGVHWLVAVSLDSLCKNLFHRPLALTDTPFRTDFPWHLPVRCLWCDSVTCQLYEPNECLGTCYSAVQSQKLLNQVVNPGMASHVVVWNCMKFIGSASHTHCWTCAVMLTGVLLVSSLSKK